MSYNPYDFTGRAVTANDTHGPRKVDRLRPGEYSPDFLQDLRSTGAVKEVPSTWSGNLSSLPPGVNWILHVNGELERIRFT